MTLNLKDTDSKFPDVCATQGIIGPWNKFTFRDLVGNRNRKQICLRDKKENKVPYQYIAFI